MNLFDEEVRKAKKILKKMLQELPEGIEYAERDGDVPCLRNPKNEREVCYFQGFDLWSTTRGDAAFTGPAVWNDVSMRYAKQSKSRAIEWITAPYRNSAFGGDPRGAKVAKAAEAATTDFLESAGLKAG